MSVYRAVIASTIRSSCAWRDVPEGVSLSAAGGKFRHRVPEFAADPLELGEFRLGKQGCDGRGGLNLRGAGGLDVGRALTPGLEAQALVLLTGDPLRQPGCPLGMLGIGVYADELAAGEGGHLYLLVPAGVGGEPGGPGVFPPGLLNGHGVPHAADSGDDAAVLDALQKFRIRAAGKTGTGGGIQHGPRHIRTGDGTLRAVPGAVIGEAVLIQADLQAGVAEKCVDIPGRGPVHCHQAAGLCGDLQHPIQGLHVLRREVCFIIIEKIAVVRRQGIGVKGTVYTGGLHRCGEAGRPDGLGVFHGVQPAGGSQGGHLIVGKGEDVRSVLQIPQQHVLAVGFALRLEGDLKAGFPGVTCLEGGDDLLKKGLVFLRPPDGQGNGLRLDAGRRGRRRLFPAGREQKEDSQGQEERKAVFLHDIRPFLWILAAALRQQCVRRRAGGQKLYHIFLPLASSPVENTAHKTVEAAAPKQIPPSCQRGAGMV